MAPIRGYVITGDGRRRVYLRFRTSAGEPPSASRHLVEKAFVSKKERNIVEQAVPTALKALSISIQVPAIIFITSNPVFVNRNTPPSRGKTRLAFIALALTIFIHGIPHSHAGEPGMVALPGGEFTMGSDASYAQANEKPAHRVQISPFLIDIYPVTNADYAKFVAATGYKTVAERPVDWEELKKQVPPGTPKPPDEMLQPGALVFQPTSGPVPLNNMANWWVWVPGANWQHPEGPDSTIKGRENHPVVQIAWEDAEAYAKWAGKRLPTEAEWEYAARGGLVGKRYAWGDEELLDGKYLTNRWTGEFPYHNTAADGFIGTSPVGSFPANGYGLYDMGGNVWNWCADIYHGAAFCRAVRRKDQGVLRSSRSCDGRIPSAFCPATPLLPMCRGLYGGSSKGQLPLFAQLL